MKFVSLLLSKKIFFLVWLIACLACLPTAAQQNLPAIDVAKILLHDSIHLRTACFQDSLHNVTPEQLTQLSFNNPPKNIFRYLKTAQVAKDWWICFQLQNSADSTINVYFFPGVYASTIDLYLYDSVLGKVTALPVLLPDFPDSIGFRRISLPPRHQARYYAHLKFVHTSVNAMDLRLIRDYYVANFSRNIKISLNNGNMYTYIITGILLMMIFYSMAVFILNGSVEFMYYACFALFTGMLFFLKSFYTKSTVPFNYFFESYLDFVIQSLGVFFYYIFLRKFLDTKNHFPFLDKLFAGGQLAIIISLSLFSYCNFVSGNYAMQEIVEAYTKYLWMLTTVLFIIYALFLKIKMLNFLAAGHFFLLLFSILSVALIYNPNLLNIPPPSVLRDSIFYYELGMTVELIFFLMALAFKNRHDLIERTREREKTAAGK